MVTERIEITPNIHNIDNFRVLKTPRHRREKQPTSRHSMIFSNGNHQDIPLTEAHENNGGQQNENTSGTPGWKFDTNIRNYVPIGPIERLRDRYGRFLKEE